MCAFKQIPCRLAVMYGYKDVTPCNPVHMYWQFRETCQTPAFRCRQQVLPKRRDMSTRLHSIRSLKPVISVVIPREPQTSHSGDGTSVRSPDNIQTVAEGENNTR